MVAESAAPVAAVGAEPAAVIEPASAPQGCARLSASVAPFSQESPASATVDHFSAADCIVDALRSINTPVRVNQSYYISNFDPNVNDIETLCEEVDRTGFSINLKKCSFLSTKIEYLGRTISQGQVRPSEQKV
ncbi:unnamed protein product [Euphydryas editha]|uniref:Reverse transcriptase domain-containing protein n=1 Tax=Euphydryas editha TaxID=104508 RepID=A0AAU9UR37_EUPED|nr:unnamed protein product [Euphydryas editha]